MVYDNDLKRWVVKGVRLPACVLTCPLTTGQTRSGIACGAATTAPSADSLTIAGLSSGYRRTPAIIRGPTARYAPAWQGSTDWHAPIVYRSDGS